MGRGARGGTGHPGRVEAAEEQIAALSTAQKMASTAESEGLVTSAVIADLKQAEAERAVKEVRRESAAGKSAWGFHVLQAVHGSEACADIPGWFEIKVFVCSTDCWSDQSTALVILTTCTLLNSSAAIRPSVESSSVQISSSILLPGNFPLGRFFLTGVTQALALLTTVALCSNMGLDGGALWLPLSSSSAHISSIMLHAAYAPCGCEWLP